MNVGDNMSGLAHECYEEMLRGDAKIFYRYSKSLSLSPFQVLRYSFGGKPLWFNNISNGSCFFKICVCAL